MSKNSTKKKVLGFKNFEFLICLEFKYYNLGFVV